MVERCARHQLWETLRRDPEPPQGGAPEEQLADYTAPYPQDAG